MVSVVIRFMQPLEYSPGGDQFLPISTHCKLIVPQCEAKSQELKFDFMIYFKNPLNLNS